MLRLKIPDSEVAYPLDEVTFIKGEDSHDNYFLLRSSKEEKIEITVPYRLNLYDTYSSNDFECYPFSSPYYYREQDIFQVKVDNKSVGRIGWIFPIQSLSSTDHSFAENEHFLRYAFVAFRKLLIGEYFSSDYVFEALAPSGEFSITAIYKSELIALCTSKNKTNEVIGFDINNFIPSLYSLSYFYCEDSEDIVGEIVHERDDLGSSFTLKEISSVLKNEVFIISLFKSLLKRSTHPLVQFHLLYQVVEILIDRIYDVEIEKILIVSKNKEKDPHNILEDIDKIHKEDNRIIKLIDLYLKPYTPSKGQLIRKCKEFLELIEEKSKAHVGLAFYQVRNKIVHSFKTINQKDPNYLIFSQFVEIFELFIIEVLVNYNEPKEKEEFDSLPIEWLKYQLLYEKRY